MFFVEPTLRFYLEHDARVFHRRSFTYNKFSAYYFPLGAPGGRSERGNELFRMSRPVEDNVFAFIVFFILHHLRRMVLEQTDVSFCLALLWR